MPVRIEHCGDLPHLCGERVDARLGHSRNVYPDVQQLVAPELGHDTARKHIEMLKVCQEAWQRPRVRFSRNAETENLYRFGRRIFVTHEKNSSYSTW